MTFNALIEDETLSAEHHTNCASHLTSTDQTSTISCIPYNLSHEPTTGTSTTRMKRKRYRNQKQYKDIMFLSIFMSIMATCKGFQISSPSGNIARYQNQRLERHGYVLLARSSAPSVEAVQPLKSSTKEKRMSVQKAWEEAQALVIDEEESEDTLSATPYLDLFTDAGIASVKKIPSGKKQQLHARPKGRPASVAGAMSRTTLLNLNEIESRPFQKKNGNGVAQATKTRITRNLGKSGVRVAPKKRGRGRPRKNKGATEDASVDEITSIAATSARDVSDVVGGDGISTSARIENGILSEEQKKVKSRVKTLSKARVARQMKDSAKEGETTGMMQAGKRGRKGKEEPPNLQRYYRTQLLTQEEEYTLGMSIQFLMKCEQVHEGLFQKLGRAPSIVEWAEACGFDEADPIRSVANYEETELESQIRPIKSEAWDVEQDPNMFVGNGLATESGPGRGRGRAKKVPPTTLKNYYDDSDTKFLDEKPKKKAGPINRGTPDDFIDLMLTGKESKQKMVQCNMRLVVSISKRYKHVGVNIADLVQEGSIGLTRAAEKFDAKKGFKFSTYASWWIQQAVFRAIAYHSRTIRLPVHVHNLLNRVRRVQGELKRLYGRSPTNEEIAAELDMPVEKFVKMLQLTRNAISLDMAKYQNNPKDVGQESDTSLGDTIDAADVLKDENSPQQNVDRTLFRDDLKGMLKILGDDERKVICERYGIDDGITRTVTTVASKLGKTKSWVRSQECRALRKLRRPWYEKRLWEHQNSLRG